MKYKLSEILELIGGGTPKTSKLEYWDGDIPWLSVKDFNNDNRYVYQTEKTITQLGLENSSTKLLQQGDVIISARGTVGEIATIPFPMAFNQSCYGLRAKQTIVTEDFLYYLIKDKVSILKKNTHGSVFDTITRDTFDRIEVDVPDLEHQRKISAILSDLDTKIELNNAINKNLEEQTQAIYKAWFVDFEPFGGTAPYEWPVIPLGNIAVIKTNNFSPIKNSSVMLEHYSIPAYDEKRYPVFELGENVKSNKYMLTKESLLISKLNPNTKRIWRPLCLSEFPVCSTEFIVYEASIPGYKDFIYSVIDSSNFSNYLCAHTTGSTNSRQRTIPSKTLEFQFPMAPNSIIQKFCGLVTPIYDRISTNICENQRLAAIRGTLLPKLMSGELDVSDISF